MAAETTKDAPKEVIREFKTARMKELFARIQQEQKRLGWSDAKLCEVATQLVSGLDPYKRMTATTVEFIARLKPRLLEPLLSALQKTR